MRTTRVGGGIRRSEYQRVAVLSEANEGRCNTADDANADVVARTLSWKSNQSDTKYPLPHPLTPAFARLGRIAPGPVLHDMTVMDEANPPTSAT